MSRQFSSFRQCRTSGGLTRKQCRKKFPRSGFGKVLGLYDIVADTQIDAFDKMGKALGVGKLGSNIYETQKKIVAAPITIPIAIIKSAIPDSALIKLAENENDIRALQVLLDVMGAGILILAKDAAAAGAVAAAGTGGVAAAAAAVPASTLGLVGGAMLAASAGLEKLLSWGAKAEQVRRAGSELNGRIKEIKDEKEREKAERIGLSKFKTDRDALLKDLDNIKSEIDVNVELRKIQDVLEEADIDIEDLPSGGPLNQEEISLLEDQFDLTYDADGKLVDKPIVGAKPSALTEGIRQDALDARFKVLVGEELTNIEKIILKEDGDIKLLPEEKLALEKYREEKFALTPKIISREQITREEKTKILLDIQTLTDKKIEIEEKLKPLNPEDSEKVMIEKNLYNAVIYKNLDILDRRLLIENRDLNEGRRADIEDVDDEEGETIDEQLLTLTEIAELNEIAEEEDDLLNEFQIELRELKKIALETDLDDLIDGIDDNIREEEITKIVRKERHGMTDAQVSILRRVDAKEQAAIDKEEEEKEKLILLKVLNPEHPLTDAEIKQNRIEAIKIKYNFTDAQAELVIIDEDKKVLKETAKENLTELEKLNKIIQDIEEEEEDDLFLDDELLEEEIDDDLLNSLRNEPLPAFPGAHSAELDAQLEDLISETIENDVLEIGDEDEVVGRPIVSNITADTKPKGKGKKTKQKKIAKKDIVIETITDADNAAKLGREKNEKFFKARGIAKPKGFNKKKISAKEQRALAVKQMKEKSTGVSLYNTLAQGVLDTDACERWIHDNRERINLLAPEFKQKLKNICRQLLGKKTLRTNFK